MYEIKEKFTAALAYLIDKKNVKQAALARECGMSPSALAGYKSGRREGREDVRKNISEALGYHYEEMLLLGQWILDGKNPEELLRNIKITHPKNLITKTVGIAWKSAGSITPAEMPKHRVPLISFVQAGDWGNVYDPYQPGYAEEWVATTVDVGPRAFALKVNGPSMETEFREGDRIVVDPDIQVESGDFVIAKNGDDEATFKKYVKDGDRHFLVPLNAAWGGPMEMTGKEWHIVGRVMEKSKKY